MDMMYETGLVVWRESFEALLTLIVIWIAIKKNDDFNFYKFYFFGSVLFSILFSFGLAGFAFQSLDFFDSSFWNHWQFFLLIGASLMMVQMMYWMNGFGNDLKKKISFLNRRSFFSVISIILLIFLSICREAFETFVFMLGIYQSAQDSGASLQPIAWGFVGGLILSLICGVVYTSGLKVFRLSIFFFLTNLGLIYIAQDLFLKGIGQGMDLGFIPLIDTLWIQVAFLLPCLFIVSVNIRKIIGEFAFTSSKKSNVLRTGLFLIVASGSFTNKAKADTTIQGYGVVDYKKFQTFKTLNNYSPFYREQIDLSEFAIETEMIFEKGNSLEFEIEFEHGGTGSAFEFEPLEEFGEFETETEKGGEIVISELFYNKRISEKSLVRIGKFPLRMGLSSILSDPRYSISPEASRLEEGMIPVGWNEVGLQFEAKLRDFKFRSALVNGLNSEFFRTYNWIGGGYQRHFEEINTDGKAIVINVDWGNVEHEQGLAVSYYQGDAAKNRYKTDKLNESAMVRIFSALGNYRLGDFVVQGQYVKGYLDNASQITQANTTLGGLAQPKAFASLGSQAVLKTFLGSYDLTSSVALYFRYDYVNSFLVVSTDVNALPRYEREDQSIGLRWIMDEQSQLKFEFGEEKSEMKELPKIQHVQVSFVMGFDGIE